MGEWLIYDRRTAPVKDQPVVSLQKRGTFGMNRASYEALSHPLAVTLMYNPRTQTIGFKPAEASDPRAYPVREQSQGSSWQTAGKAFLQHHGIPIPEHSRRYMAQLIDGMLVVNLEQAGEGTDTTEIEKGVMSGP
jgi:hypothetical protein